MKRFLASRTSMALIAAACALAAAACASNAPRPDLSGTEWTATSIAGAPVAGVAPTIEFTQDRIAGTGGCNRFFGGYAASDGQLSFTGIGTTRMACEEALMNQEDAFLGVLNGVNSFSKTDGALTLRTADGRTIEFRAS